MWKKNVPHVKFQSFEFISLIGGDFFLNLSEKLTSVKNPTLLTSIVGSRPLSKLILEEIGRHPINGIGSLEQGKPWVNIYRQQVDEHAPMGNPLKKLLGKLIGGQLIVKYTGGL